MGATTKAKIKAALAERRRTLRATRITVTVDGHEVQAETVPQHHLFSCRYGYAPCNCHAPQPPVVPAPADQSGQVDAMVYAAVAARDAAPRAPAAGLTWATVAGLAIGGVAASALLAAVLWWVAQ